MLLLAASYYFYMSWNPWYLSLILLSTGIDFLSSHKIDQSLDQSKRKQWLMVSILLNLGILFTFKYFNFFVDSFHTLMLNWGFETSKMYLQVILPVGISFYTFQTMSYTIDVYQGRIKAERHLGYFALYVAFFPQLVAGPIERASHLIPQFKRKARLTMDDVYIGINRIVYGFFKKVVIADRLSVYVGNVFGDVESASAIAIATGAFFFLIQVYCDFSGYSDIAVGISRLMGFDLIINFSRPFISTSFAEYWKRWHISLSLWVRDYIYIPLGGNRVKEWRWYFNTVFAFTLMGLWHGANWTYVLWGLAHGSFLAAENGLKKHGLNKISNNIRKPVGWFIVMSVFVLSMIFFRSENVNDAFVAFERLFMLEGAFTMKNLKGNLSVGELGVNGFVILLLALSYLLPQSFNFRFNNIFIVTVLFLILVLGTYEKIEFVYFQF
jgi:alginate O-acetyltransferase complex protein AlgI